jgi:heme exporter protein B
LLFFLAVAMLYPFAVGPDARLLARTGARVIWVAALLAAILPLDRLVEPDVEAGCSTSGPARPVGRSAAARADIRPLDQLWRALMLAAPISAGLLSLDGGQLAMVELGLLLGTPGWQPSG